MKRNKKFPVLILSRCIQCYECIVICPADAITIPTDAACSKCIKYCITLDVPCHPEKLVFDYDRCDECGRCISTCPCQALKWHQELKLTEN